MLRRTGFLASLKAMIIEESPKSASERIVNVNASVMPFDEGESILRPVEAVYKIPEAYMQAQIMARYQLETMNRTIERYLVETGQAVEVVP